MHIKVLNNYYLGEEMISRIKVIHKFDYLNGSKMFYKMVSMVAVGGYHGD